jgi:ketosteroid isomerase-like protein
MDLDDVISRYHRALDEFSRGDPDAMKTLYSEAEDVILANPFGPARCGRQATVEALEYASGRFHDGKVTGFDEVVRYLADDLATMFENEHWQSRIGENNEILPWDLRVTTTFRREEGGWKIVLRHADPIATDDPSGPLRAR